MLDPVQVIKRDGYTISIYYDEYPENPRQCNDYLCEIICWHDKYDLGDRTVRRGEMAEVLNTYISDKYFHRPVYLYDHGGITMSLGGFDAMIEHQALKVAEGMLSIKNPGRTMKV